MADELNFDRALELARRLKTIPSFPWDDDNILATAQDLMRWCKGAFPGGAAWSADDQADWLVTEARENWEKWRSTAELHAMFKSRFAPQPKSGNAAIDFANEPCVCGSGERFRVCCMGKSMPPIDLAAVKTLSDPKAITHMRSADEQAQLDRIAEQIRVVER